MAYALRRPPDGKKTGDFKIMKKILVFISASFLIFSSCNEKSSKTAFAQTSQKFSDSQNISKKSEIPDENPEIEKLGKVLSSMSQKCKDAIPNGNPEEFLADLHRVLESEKNFSSDDLSPFYLIDKTHNVGADYEPKNLIHLEKNDLFAINKNTLSLRPESYEALKTLAKAAKNDGVTLTISSSYRSYEYQKNLFAYWVKVDGLEEAERESARAGTSQHQLGMAIDFAPVDDAFAETVPGQWVYKNAAKYGWSLSFPKEREDVTGYRWESWHFRYIGVEACEFQKKWFSDVQQFMMEFLNEWKQSE